jgi:transposase
MGKEHEVPRTDQLYLFPKESRPLDKHTEPPLPARFKAGNPERLFIGEEPLQNYLIDSGKGWVIRFRAMLFEQDASGFIEKYTSTGRKPYHPFLILGLILYGAQMGRWSLRQLEDLAKLELGAWWICGGLRPDHSTIGDFIHLHSELLSAEFFINLTSNLVKRLGISSGSVAGDGTVIEAASSRFKMLKREAAEEALAKAKKESGEDSETTKKCQTALETVEERDRKRKRKGRGKNAAKVCPDEPEATVQPRKDGVMRPSYKPSILADKNRLIVGQHVDPNSEMASVVPMLEQYRGVFDSLPMTSLWDGNYNTFEMLELSISTDMNVLCGVAPDQESPSKKQIPKSDFRYDESQDEYICPEGQRLKYRKSGTNNGRPYREYQCQSCNGCKKREKCTKSKTGRSIIRYQGEELKEAMRDVLEQPRAKRHFRYRKAFVEPPFGELHYKQGLHRFRRKGMKKVRVEFALHCMAYNLTRVVRREEAAQGLKEAPNSAYITFQVVYFFRRGLNQLQIAIFCSLLTF